MKTYKEYQRYFFVEKQFRDSIVVLLLMVVIILVQLKWSDIKNHEVERMEHEYQLVLRIPEFKQAIEERLRAIHQEKQKKIEVKQVVKPPPPPPIESKLQGIFIMGNTPMATIDNAQYQVGDVIQDFIILEITMTSVTIRNIKTNEVKKLQFSNEDELDNQDPGPAIHNVPQEGVKPPTESEL